MSGPTQTQPQTDPQTDPLAWIDMMGQVARHYRMPFAEQRARLTTLWQGGGDEEARVRALARASGLSVRFVVPGAMRLTSWRLPVIAWLNDGELALITGIDADGQAVFSVAGEEGQSAQRPLSTLVEQTRIFVVPAPPVRRRMFGWTAISGPSRSIGFAACCFRT
ncbi:hypothetical protein GCM10020258_29370 [Sphingomonas yabuuchiae]